MLVTYAFICFVRIYEGIKWKLGRNCVLVLSSCGKYNNFTVSLRNWVNSYLSILGNPSNFLDLNALGILYLVRYKAWFQSIYLQRKNENVAILIIKNCELVKVTCNNSQSMFLIYTINEVHALKFLQIFAPYDD
jgi:hypothetical protein